MASKLTIRGGNWYSYQTMIRQQVGSVTIGNVTQYTNRRGNASRTTTRHQKMACVHSCQIVLDNVPEGTTDLIPLAFPHLTMPGYPPRDMYGNDLSVGDSFGNKREVTR